MEPLTEEEVDKVENQFQIGDRVVYRPEGVICLIEGYVWNDEICSTPAIVAYRLDCGLDAVPASVLIEWD